MNIQDMNFAIAYDGSCHVWNLYETEEAAIAAIPDADKYTGKAHKLITDIDAWFTNIERNSVTDAKRIDVEQYDYLLEVLPPMNWHNDRGVSVFFMSEFDFMGVTTQVAKRGEVYASKTVIYRDKSTWITPEEMAALA